MPLTHAQQQALATQGNVLLMAGAGTGKTHTLVEFCLTRLLDPVAGIGADQLFMVTFTENAAAEMRRRIRQRLESELARQPENVRLEEQVALLENAHISTLHAFCAKLVREHFSDLHLDPQLTVLEEGQARLLAEQVLDQIMQRHYAADDAADRAVRNLVEERTRGGDQAIRDLILQIHRYSQTLPSPARYLAAQRKHFETAEPTAWREQWATGLREEAPRWLDLLEDQPPDAVVPAQCADALRDYQADPAPDAWVRLTECIRLADGQGWPKGKKTLFRGPVRHFFDAFSFIATLLPTGVEDPLAKDWQLARPQLLVLVALAEEFARAFAAEKRQQAALDFPDLEQFALRLLVDAQGAPTHLARLWQNRLRLVVVDEYQDINAAQDAIITSLARVEGEANRFLVGDVKQSIYRFRMANPRIFQAYAHNWRTQPALGTVIPLADNFRSHEGILRLANACFRRWMRADTGEILYDTEAELHFGAAADRPHHQQNEADPGQLRAELLLADLRNSTEEESETDEEPDDTDRAEAEARLIAHRLRELRGSGFPVFDKAAGTLRPVGWQDMVILLRAPRSRVETLAKTFAALGIPLVASRAGFFDSIEVLDLLNLLRLLDNPLQDLPLLAVLRSPLARFTMDELAEMRLLDGKAPFWELLQRRTASVATDEEPLLIQKTRAFLHRYQGWRTLARRGALSHCLERILDDTHYPEWCTAQPRGEQQLANVQQLLQLTRQFDPLERQGLYRFLAYAEARINGGIAVEPAAASAGDAVRLMSFHQSKGLEFPVVVIGGLDGRFNLKDGNGDILLTEELGLCPRVRPPGTRLSYPSPAHWLASRSLRRQTLAEELRLLYVAMTRACDLLIMTGRITGEQHPRWEQEPGRPQQHLLTANSYLDWLAPWIAQTGQPLWWESPAGHNEFLRWRMVPGTAPSALPATATETAGETPAEPDWQILRQRLEWTYPHQAATREIAKSSVSELRSRASDGDETLAGSLVFQPRAEGRGDGRLSAAQKGTAHHLVLQLVSPEQAASALTLRGVLEQMVRDGQLTPAEQAAIALDSIVRFWNSPEGLLIRRQDPACRHTELPFTARFELAELHQLGLLPTVAGDEFVVVQGAIDLAVILPGEIWVLDFKTDALKPGQETEKARQYAPQVQAYALALQKAFQRPVTRAWLHFLKLGRTCDVTPVSNPSGTPAG